VNHQDHVQLIEAGIGRGTGGVWADLGAGSGAFTLALRDVAGPDVQIYAVDRDRSALNALRGAFARSFPGSNLHLLPADFAAPLELPLLDGIVAANSLHFSPNQGALLAAWRRYLKPDGRLILVEYDTDRGNRWVPYPISFAAFGPLAKVAGFAEPALIGSRSSRFLDGMYAAMTVPSPGPHLSHER
jgi:ubiquinone/menaquinone biosynthesis C-methylase UbiE